MKKNHIYTMGLDEIENFTKNIIPKLEIALKDNSCDQNKLDETFKVYKEALRQIAPYDFVSFNKYIELYEDWDNEQKQFYGHRSVALKDLFDAMNDMEIYDKYDTLVVCMPPRIGKTTTGIRFLSWIIGRHPESTQMATSYADNVTKSFYNGVIELIMSEEYQDCFPESPLVNQNAKREEIWLRKNRRYPSIAFIPIDGAMTGRGEANNYLYCDDLVSGQEEALSQDRLSKLWDKYSINVKQRKKNNCKEIHVATPWSVHDVITKVSNANDGNPRCKIIKLSCYNEDGESNFDYIGGFSTEYYKELEKDMDKITFDALYKQDPIEREGLLFNKDEFQYYKELPSDIPDSIIAVCDSKNLGNDSVACPIGYLFENKLYIEDVVFNNGLPSVTKPLVANKLVKHRVKDFSIEMNNGGNYYGEDVKSLVHDVFPGMRFSMFFSTSNKDVRIISYSDFIKKHFVFKDPSTYLRNSEYGKFMGEVFRYTQTGKNKHDDAPDSLSMLASKVDSIINRGIKFLDRRELGI